MEDNQKKILLISDNQTVQQHVEDNLLLGFEMKVSVETCMIISDALRQIEEKDYDVLIYGMNIGPKDYMEALDRIMLARPDIPVIIVLAKTTKYLAAEALKKGAREYIIPDLGEDVKLRTAVKYIVQIRDLQRSFQQTKNRLDRLTEEDEANMKETENDQPGFESKSIMTGMEYTRMLSSGLSRDMNKELVLMRTYIDNMKRFEDDPEKIGSGLKKITGSIRNLDRMMEQLLLFSGRKNLKDDVVDLSEILSEVMDDIEVGDRKEVVFNVNNGDSGFLTKGNRSSIAKVIKNVIYNSIESFDDGGRIDIFLTSKGPERKGGSPSIILSVKDDGCGIPHDLLEKVFQPFFTTRSGTSNPGLGLSISYGIMKKLGGDIGIESDPGKGTTVTLVFPSMVESGTIRKKTPSFTGDLRGNGERILLLEDKEVLLTLASKTLAENGYIVFMTKDPQEARKLFKMEKGRFDLILIDLFLENEDPISLIDGLYKIRDGVPVKFIVSASDQRPPTIIARKSFTMIRAPIKPYELLRSIKTTLKGVVKKKRKDEAIMDFLDGF
jgi:signal transduction histidine kinase